MNQLAFYQFNRKSHCFSTMSIAIFLLMTSLSGETAKAATNVLIPNQVVIIEGKKDQQLLYQIDLTQSHSYLTVELSGGTGDADFYVKTGEFQAWPTTSDYNCRPYKSGNEESCYFENASGMEYFVMLKAYQAFEGVTLMAKYEQ
ncbi:PPC domain-containing protein [Aliikangiella maris]|uniref:PPC domain-containing protein n=2 Tax=Aliikangiella maris TaxID=3162458 RepID=A0ABV2BRQ7_9GAMM